MEAESPLEFRLVHTARVTPSYGLPVRSAFPTTLQGLCLHALVISMLFFQDRYTEGFDQLSHGGPNGLASKLMKSTMGAFKDGTATSKLPRTFMEAIQLCMLLVIQYICIDALCMCS